MQASINAVRRTLFALCVLAVAACAPESDPVGVSAIPTDVSTFAAFARANEHARGHELVECESLRASNPACEERCQLEIR